MLVFGDLKPAVYQSSCLQWLKAIVIKWQKVIKSERFSNREAIVEELPTL